MLRPAASRLAALSIALVLTSVACAPTTGLTVEAAFDSQWTGPIETIALVMEPPMRTYEPLVEPAFNLSQLEFTRHPYALQRFDLVERTALERVLGELRLGSSGLVDSATAPELGRLLGAQYVLIVDLANANVRQSSLGGIRIEGFTFGGAWADLSVTLVARLVDVTTGRVVATGSGSAESSVMTGLSLDGMGFGSSATRDLVLELVPEAARRAFNDLFRRIS